MPRATDQHSIIGERHPEGALRRLLGPVTIGCVGVGGAIGSGVFATPGEAAKHLQSPWILLSAWMLAGILTLLQTLVTAELATRFPRAGGEYQYLKEAYGPFAAFFFGWSFTIFIVGGGAGTIAAAFGTFAAELMRMNQRWAPPALGCAALITVAAVNSIGLRTGAITQNLLTLLKTLALLAIAVGVWLASGRLTPRPSGAAHWVAGEQPWLAYMLGLLQAFWAYTGATDPAKLAEEVKDVRRSLPLALVTSALALTFVYGVYNYALLCAATPAEMAGRQSVPATIFQAAGWGRVNNLVLAASALICLGAISSVFLANVRVTYALARDGLSFHWLASMSRSQAPTASILVGAALACGFVANRSFAEILQIYFLASTVLFGLSYASLVVFRLRDRRERRGQDPNVYRVPLGIPLAVTLVLVELLIAAGILWSDYRDGSLDSLWTLALLAATAVFYGVWRRLPGGTRASV